MLREPVPEETRALLAARWRRLDPALRRWNQVLGRQVVDCGFTLGAPYCSLSCTHCYLPRTANEVPLPSLEQMREQIRVSREHGGPGSSLQITGGDVIDAYLRTGRFDELVLIVRESVEAGLIPMVMTHGQGLLEDPRLLQRLMLEGLLSRVAIHIDTTQAGRPGWPRIREGDEARLAPLRQRFVDLVRQARRSTGRRLSAALTVTVTERNLHSIASILEWLLADARRCAVFRTVSFQPEAAVGRTLSSASPPTADQTWRALERALPTALPDQGLLFGDPRCSRVVPLLALFPRAGRPATHALPLIEEDPASRHVWGRALAGLGGAKGEGGSAVRSLLRKSAALSRDPGLLFVAARYLTSRLRRQRALGAALRATVAGRARVFALVLHDFIDAHRLETAHDDEVAARLQACALRGPVRTEDGWEMQPMCLVNAATRPENYRRELHSVTRRRDSVPGTTACASAAPVDLRPSAASIQKTPHSESLRPGRRPPVTGRSTLR